MTAAGWVAAASAVALAGALAQLHGAASLVGGGGPRGEGVASGHAKQVVASASRTAAGRHALAGALAFGVVLPLASPVKGVLAAVLAVGGSMLRARRAAHARRRRCEGAVPALARALADALRGGASVRSALAAAGEDRSVPAVMRNVVQRQTRGLAAGASLATALTAFAAQGGPSTRLLCGSIALHLDAGGALASELDRIAAAGEAGRKVEEERVAATAQARATVRVVAALPLLAMAGAQLASPGFLSTLAESPLASALLLAGLTLEVVAVILARAIVGPAT